MFAENFTTKSVERYLQEKAKKLNFRLGVKRWRGPPLQFLLRQTICNDGESLCNLC